MGNTIIDYYNKKIKTEYKTAFISTFITCLLIHLYKFTNTLLNHDSVYNYYSDQNVIGSGRWALTYACGLSSYYDLPWINGLLSCIFISLTIIVIVKLFEIKNPIIIVLSGALLAASPATTETFFFLFTADGYMLAMFMSALAVYFSKIDETKKSRFIISSILLCLTCGIYQAYISFALILALSYFIYVLFNDTYSKKECWNWVLRQAIIYITSLVVYYIIWKILLKVSNATIYDYQGISSVGTLSLKLVVNGFINSIKSVLLYFIQWDILERGVTLYSVLNILFLILMIIGIIVSIIKSKILSRGWATFLLTLSLLAIIPFSCIWSFTSDSIGYRPMMLQSLTILFILTALLYEKWTNVFSKNFVCLLLITIVFNNALLANISYFYMNLCYERTYAEGLEMIIKIHDLQGKYNIEEIAIIGDRGADSLWEYQTPQTGKISPAGKLFILTSRLQTTLFYDSDHTIPFLRANFGLDLPSATAEERENLRQSKIVEEMSVWPNSNSITVFDNTVIVKLSDNPEV